MRRRELYEDNRYGYEYGDLGLPSGTLWATSNIGAHSPEEYGLYFAWGEIQGYTVREVIGFTTSLGKSVPCRKQFAWADYKWWESGSGSSSSKYVFKKYVPSSYTGTQVNVTSYDDILELEAEDDAAYMLMGKGWRMPTQEEYQELYDNCTLEWTTLNGMNGLKFISKKNGKSVFFPADGYCINGSAQAVRTLAYYWSSTLYASNPYYAYFLLFSMGGVSPSRSDIRRYGCSVRGVVRELSPVNSDYIDLGLSVHWAVCNIGATNEYEAGLYFAWGEIQGYTANEVNGYTTSLGKKVPCRRQFDKESYKWWESGDGTSSSSSFKFKKYVNGRYSYAQNGMYYDISNNDDITELQREDDAAYMLMGKGWRIPTQKEYQELIGNGTFTATIVNGVYVTKITMRKNNKSIIFPHKGYIENDRINSTNYGYYWTFEVSTNYQDSAYSTIFNSSSMPSTGNLYSRWRGYNIRGVLTIKYPNPKDKYQKMEYKVGDFD